MSESAEPAVAGSTATDARLLAEIAEALSLHALDLLPADERASLETQLAADPALRRELRELQGSLDGLVESLPARPAPLHVWGRIAATVRSAEAPMFATQGSASPTIAGQASLRTDSVGNAPEGAPAGTGVGTAGSTVGVAAVPGRDAALTHPAVPRERALQTQVAVLTELLNRELGTPPGTSRLQIVRLVGPGETAETAAATAIQPETRSALALTLLNPQATPTPVLTSTKSTTTTASTEGSGHTGSGPNTVTGGVTAPNTRADVAEVASGSLAAAISTPVVQVQQSTTETVVATPSSTVREAGTTTGKSSGFASSTVAPGVADRTAVAGVGLTQVAGSTGSSPTGVLLMLPKESAGTAVISNPTPLTANEVYQFWQTDPATGTAINLGTAPSDASTAIFNFSLTQGKSPSAVSITREPSGGSATPTGPVVVSTPAPKP